MVFFGDQTRIIKMGSHAIAYLAKLSKSERQTFHGGTPVHDARIRPGRVGGAS